MSTDSDNDIQRPAWSLLYNTDCSPEDSYLPDETGETEEVFSLYAREGSEFPFTKPEDLFNFILKSEILNSNQIFDLIAQSGFRVDFLFQEFGTYLDILCNKLTVYPANFVEEAVDGVYVNNLSTSSLAKNLSRTFKREATKNSSKIFEWLTTHSIDRYKGIMIMENIILQVFDHTKNQKKLQYLK